jgi:hypothetical protein
MTSSLAEGSAVQEQIERYLRENPEIAKTLEVFQVSADQYQAALSAQQPVRTIVAEHSLLPDERC